MPQGARKATAGPLHDRGGLRRRPAARDRVPGRARRPTVIPELRRHGIRGRNARGRRRPYRGRAPTRIPHPERCAREAERRQMTVLVCGCELFESDAYLENLDAEAQADVLRDFQQACEQAVRRFDGTIVQCNSRGCWCASATRWLSRTPRAAPLRPASASSRTSSSSSSGSAVNTQLELNPWVGIHTGAAIVEMGENAISLVGEARNVATRLEDVAEPGHIVCSAATHRLIRQPSRLRQSRQPQDQGGCAACRNLPGGSESAKTATRSSRRDRLGLHR